MKTGFRLMLVLLLLIGAASFAQEQSPAVTHNTWSSGTPMPTPVVIAASAVLKTQIFVVGGNASNVILDDVQIYTPKTNNWSAGVPFPTVIEAASAAVVKNILYVFGGTSDGTNASNAVWAYNPKTKTWSSVAAMPTPRFDTNAVVVQNIVYVMGGYNSNQGYLSTVESYNPATNTWTEQASLPLTDAAGAAGVLGTTIVMTDGAIAPGFVTNQTEGYSPASNSWTTLASDQVSGRLGSCFGSIGTSFYDAGGYQNDGGAAITNNYAYNLSKNAWTSALAPMPQGTMIGASAVYKKQLYCIGGWATWQGNPIGNVQIYQP